MDFEEPTPPEDQVCLGCTPRECKTNKKDRGGNRKLFKSSLSGGTIKPLTLSRGRTIWEDTQRKCVERHCELSKKRFEQLYKVSTPCLDDHQCKKEELETLGELS